jgi:hypothetical protein
MRIGVTLALLAVVLMAAPACSRGDFFRQYEYEEEIELSLDGSATVSVNASVAALNALRGSSFDTSPNAPINREALRAFFTTPVTRVTRTPSLSRRGGRRFVHVRVDVDHVEQLQHAAPFAWSTYRFGKEGELVVFRQHVGEGARSAAVDPVWKGDELVAFRAQLPSTVVYHNAGAKGLKRGNILVWEQPLADRLKGEPLDLEARMESQSILSHTLLLFGAAFVAVALTFAVILWWVVRRGGTA